MKCYSKLRKRVPVSLDELSDIQYISNFSDNFINIATKEVIIDIEFDYSLDRNKVQIIVNKIDKLYYLFQSDINFKDKKASTIRQDYKHLPNIIIQHHMKSFIKAQEIQLKINELNEYMHKPKYVCCSCAVNLDIRIDKHSIKIKDKYPNLITLCEKFYPMLANRQFKWDKKCIIVKNKKEQFDLVKYAKICQWCAGKSDCIPISINERIHNETDEKYKIPEYIKIISKVKKLKDLISLGKTICSVTKKKLMSHWHGIGDLRQFVNQGMFGYFRYYKEKETHPLMKIDKIDEQNVQNCLKYLEEFNHLYKLFIPNYTIEKFYILKNKPRSTMSFLQISFILKRRILITKKMTI